MHHRREVKDMDRNEREKLNRHFYSALPDHEKVASHLAKIRSISDKPWNRWQDKDLKRGLALIDKWVDSMKKKVAEHIAAEG
jgi:hypothetical protein